MCCVIYVDVNWCWTNHLREGGYVFIGVSVSKFVCLVVGKQNYSRKKLIKLFITKFGGKAAHWPGNKWLHFGGNLDLDPVSGIF